MMIITYTTKTNKQTNKQTICRLFTIVNTLLILTE